MDNQKGNILISLLLIVMVLSILSIGVYRISHSAIIEAKFTEDNSQAYYIAKSGADLIIGDIDNIIDEMNKDKEKKFVIIFPKEGKSTTLVKLCEDNNRIKEIIINSIGEVNDSKSEINAKLTVGSNPAGDYIILGVDEKGIIYEFDKDFQNPKVKNIDQEFAGHNSFAWDGDNTLMLVGDTDDKKDNCMTSYDLGETWIRNPQQQGNGLNSVVWSEEKQTFYATQTKDGEGSNSGHIFYMKDGTWGKLSKPNEGFKIQKLAQGNETIVGISKNKNSQITYLKEYSNKWVNKNTGIDGFYNSITYGSDVFVIVGNENNNYPLICYSTDGINWYRGVQQNTMDGINNKLNDITWDNNGKKFVAVGGAGSVYTSTNGKDWYTFPRENIIKDEKLTGWGDYSNVSSQGDYIVAYSYDWNRILISQDGGKSWSEKQTPKINNKEIKLKDIILINKGDGKFDFANPGIQWSK